MEEVTTKKKDRHRPGYMRDYMRQRAAERRREIRIQTRGDGSRDFDEFREHVREEALKIDAPAAVMGIYKELLKLSAQMRQGVQLTADEIASRNLQAEKELREGGFLE